MRSVFHGRTGNLIGTKFKLVMGYTGSAEAMLAMERGEVEGHSTTWDGVKSRAAQHLRDKTQPNYPAANRSKKIWEAMSL